MNVPDRRTKESRAGAWVHGRFGSDGPAATHAAVASGLGIGLTPLSQVRSLVDEGTVEVVLEDFEDSNISIYAVGSSGKIPLAKTRLFVNELAARLKRERL